MIHLRPCLRHRRHVVYGAFSVSASTINKTCEYIAGQQVHHKRQTFQDEYGAFLRKHDMEWDERFVRE